MSLVYSRRFIGAAAAASTIATHVPVGKVWIVTHCQLGFEGGVAGDAAEIQALGALTLVSSAWPIYQGANVMRYDGKFVLTEGEELALVVYSGRWAGFACGSELSLA